MKQNFTTRSKKHWKNFTFAEVKSRLLDRVIKKGYKIKTIEETMTIINLQSSYGIINILEEIEVLKMASCQNILNHAINGRNDQIYKLLPSLNTHNSNRWAHKLSCGRNFNSQLTVYKEFHFWVTNLSQQLLVVNFHGGYFSQCWASPADFLCPTSLISPAEDVMLIMKSLQEKL